MVVFGYYLVWKNVCKLWWKAEKYLSYSQAERICNAWNLSLFIEVNLIVGWSNILFSFLSLFDSEYENKMKDSIIIPESQIQKLWKLIYSHWMVYNLCFYILTCDNDTHNVCAVVNKVRPCSLFGLKTDGLPCFNFYLFSFFFFLCVHEEFFLLKNIIIQVHAEIESCYSYIIFHWIVASCKEIQLNFPCRHRASFRMPL